MIDAAMNLAAAAAIVAAMAGLGRALWGWSAPSAAAAFGSGAAVLSAILFALLAAGLYRPWVLILATAAFIAAGRWKLSRPRVQRPPLWAAALTTVYGGFYIVHALAPEIQPDAAGYHLGLAQEWLRLGGFADRVGFYEILPLGVEAVFGAGLALAGAPTAKLIHLAFLLMTGPAMVDLARGLGLGDRVAWAAWALYAMAPVAAVSSTSAYTDAALVFGAVLVAGLLLTWARERSALVALHLGLAAGFCYSVKMTGILATALAAVYIMRRRDWRCITFFATGVIAVGGLWMARAWFETGNPLAPLGNAFFDNDAFNAETERVLASRLRTHDLASWTAIPLELFLRGEKLHGLLGPALALLLLALAGLRRMEVRWLLLAAAVAAAPWTANLGARFLLPAIPFLAMAFAATVPWRAAAGLVLLHGAFGLPPVLESYCGAAAWRLKGWPWRAAVGAERPGSYLRSNLWEYRLAREVANRVAPGEAVLDLFGLPMLYTGVGAIGPMPTVVFDRLRSSMSLASRDQVDRVDELRISFDERFYRAVRVRTVGVRPPGPSVRELEFYWKGNRIDVQRMWFVDAWPSPQEGPLAVDGNLSTRWGDPASTPGGGFVEVRFDRPAPLTEVAVVSEYLIERADRVEVYSETLDGRWQSPNTPGRAVARTMRPLRRDASKLLRSHGVRWIIARAGEGDLGLIGNSMLFSPEDWGVEPVVGDEDVWLFRMK